MSRIFTQTFGVVGDIVEKDGKIALVKEGDHTKLDAGKWNQPAGWIEVGEDPIQAAKREIEEETGFVFNPTAILGVYSLAKKYSKRVPGEIHHPIKIILIGEVNTDNQKQLADDVLNIKWFTPEEIYAMDESTLRDMDIKQMVKDYFNGKKYPLELIHHLVYDVD